MSVNTGDILSSLSFSFPFANSDEKINGSGKVRHMNGERESRKEELIKEKITRRAIEGCFWILSGSEGGVWSELVVG